MNDLLSRLRDMRETVAAKLEARATIHRASRNILYNDEDVAVDELASKAIREDLARIEAMADIAEQEITAWAFANNVDGAVRNDLMRRVRTALTNSTRENVNDREG